MIHRNASQDLLNLAAQYKAVVVTGPRQSGKTTLVKSLFANKPYCSLENPDFRDFAIKDPRGFLAQYPDGAILDEVQRVPDLFSYLQEVLDERNKEGLFILTGSNNFLLLEKVTQSLAGRVGQLVLLPFCQSELRSQPPQTLDEYLWKGMYPPLYDKAFDVSRWYSNYIQTYLERDVRQVKNISNLIVFERFIKLCAGRAGQLLNMHSLAIEAGVDNKTIHSWISVLESSFIVFRLPPHHQNFSKRLVKMPKFYFYDTGLLCSLLGINRPEQLAQHPLRGNIFENFIITEILKERYNRGKAGSLYFWRDHTGHEIDLLLDEGGELYPVEIKSGATVTEDFFRPLAFWKKISGKAPGTVIYGGDSVQQRSEGIRVLPWRQAERLVEEGVEGV